MATHRTSAEEEKNTTRSLSVSVVRFMFDMFGENETRVILKGDRLISDEGFQKLKNRF